MTSNWLLAWWLMVDLVWGLIIFGATTYLVFWRGHSGLWYLLAIVLGASMGGDKLYKRLYERTKVEGPDER